MRRAHHPALRACPGLLPGLHRALLPGSREHMHAAAPTWHATVVPLPWLAPPCPATLHAKGAAAPAWLTAAGGWAEGKAAAKRVLVNLGELEDTDRPLVRLG